MNPNSIHTVESATQPGWLLRFWQRYADMLDRNRRSFGMCAYLIGGWYLILAAVSFLIPDGPAENDAAYLWMKFPFMDKIIFRHARRIAAAWALVFAGVSLCSTGYWLRRRP